MVLKHRAGKTLLILCGCTLGLVVHSTSSFADSLWEYKGSVVRLVIDGNARRFLFERPSSVLEEADVKQGMVLFEGTRVGGNYVGRARSFSKDCLAPLIYDVNGKEVGGTKIVLQGRRIAHDKSCRPTGRLVHEHLGFKYLESIPDKESEFLSEEQARINAIRILKGAPYGKTSNEVAKRIVKAQLITVGIACGKKIRSALWKLHVSVPKGAASSRNNNIDGVLVIDARSGALLCSDLPSIF